MSRHLSEIRLLPVTEADLDMFRRFVVEPGLIGLDWSGFHDPKAIQRRFDTDSYLGDDDGRLIVDVTAETEPGTESTGLVSYRRRHYGAQAFCWEIGIALLPKWRGQGIGWRAQAIFCSYLFRQHARSANRGGHARREHRRAALTGKSRVHPRRRHPRGRVPSGPVARRLPLQPPPHRPRPPRGLDQPRPPERASAVEAAVAHRSAPGRGGPVSAGFSGLRHGVAGRSVGRVEVSCS